MRTWVKVTIAGVGLAVLGFSALAGTGAYFFFRHLETTTAGEDDSRKEFDAVRTRFAGRAPLIDIVDPGKADIRIQRVQHPEGRRAGTLHVLTFAEKDEKVIRADVPIWLMRFSSVNVLSRLGIAPERYRLTAEDLARFGPGIVVDFQQPGQSRVLIWVE